MKINEELLLNLCQSFKEGTATNSLANGQTENTFDEITIRFDERGRFVSLTTLVDGEVFGVNQDLEVEKIAWTGVVDASEVEVEALSAALRSATVEV